MNKQEYKNIFNLEERHFIYQSTHRNIMALLKQFLPRNKNLTILDAGCGTGLLMQKLKSFGLVYGVDNNSQGLIFCKKRGLTNLKKASVNNLPFFKNTFDVITCVDVLYHKDVNGQKTLSEFFRVLKPGGLIILKVPAHENLRGKHDIFVHTRQRYKINELKKEILKQNFNIVFISYGHQILYPIVLVKRFWERILHSPESSDVAMPALLINHILINLGKLETKVMLKTGLKNGISIYAVARKPN